MKDEPLRPEEEALLSRARLPIEPPRGGEDRLVAALRQRGLLRRRRGAMVWAAIAAGVMAGAWTLWLLVR